MCSLFKGDEHKWQHDNVSLYIREFNAPLVLTFSDIIPNSLIISDLRNFFGEVIARSQ